MTETAKKQLLSKYHHGPFRELRTILAMDGTLEALKVLAAGAGNWPWFQTLSFVGEDTPEQRKIWKRDMGRLQGRLVRAFPGLKGLRIYEDRCGAGRFNAHMVTDRRVTKRDLERHKEGLSIGWVRARAIEADWGGEYLWKEITKEVRPRAG